MERNLTKQQILYLYLNQIYLGHGAYGVQAASKTYFAKDISNVTIAEAALMAGMPQAPGKFSPHLNPKRAKDRQLYVLRRMYENNFITQAQMTESAAQPLRIFHDEDLNSRYAGYLVEHIRRYLVEKYGEKAVYEEGLTVTVPTTPELSVTARRSIREGLRAVDKRIGYRGPIQRLKNDDEIEKVLKELRLKMIEKKLHFQLFTPDGRMDPIEAMREAGMKSDLDLLDPTESYPAVVTRVDDKTKTAGVMIGAVRAQLPLDQMKWAQLMKNDDKGQPVKSGEPKLPSAVVAKGDVVQVRLVRATDKEVTVALEQTPTTSHTV
jgi:penicillin-binding protein 1A